MLIANVVIARNQIPVNLLINFRKLELPVKKEIKPSAGVTQQMLFIPLLSGYDFEIKLPAKLTEGDIKTIVRALNKVKNKDLD